MLTATQIAKWFYTFHLSDTVTEVTGDTASNHTDSDVRSASNSSVTPRTSNALKLAMSDHVSCSRLSCHLGRQRETSMLDAYEHAFERSVTKRNDMIYSLRIQCSGRSVVVHGKIDGFDASNFAVVEHKRRVKRLLGFVPKHESVQCHIYMRMLECSKAYLIESFGAQMRVHTIVFTPSIWSEIVQMVGQHNDDSHDL